MIVGKTDSGFEFSIDPARLSDWDLLEAIADSTSDNQVTALAAPIKVARVLLGDQYQTFKEHCRQPDGSLPSEIVSAEIQKIFAAIREDKAGKN